MNDKTILLVEDNPDDIELTLRAFKKGNVLNPVTVVRDGTEALDYLLGQAPVPAPLARVAAPLARVADPLARVANPLARVANPAPAIVLLDLKLPKIDGLEVLRRLRADDRTRLLPVVILTSSKEEQDLVNGYRLGANSYIRKPVNFSRFIEAVHQLGLYWLLLNEPPPNRI